MVNDDNDNVQQQQQQQQQHLVARCRIQCQYEIFNELDETIIKTTTICNASNGASEVRVGLPVGIKSKKSKPGDEMYSGMHDQGPLPDLKEGGPLTLLTGCVKIAKDYNDEFLTQCIKEENENSKNHDQPNKRSKQQ